MKNPAWIIILGLLAGGAVATDLRAEFELARPIEGTFSIGQRGRIAVPGDLFGQSRTWPHDLRIFGEDDAVWPFFMYTPEARADQRTLTPQVLNRSFVSGPDSYLQFDLIIPAADGTVPVHNRLELTTTGRDFIRRVEVSDPAGGVMATGYLIDFKASSRASNHTIRYPASDSARVHVRIFSNAQRASETFEVRSARLHYLAPAVVERESVPFEAVSVSATEEQEGAQTRIFDVGHENRPVELISFDVATSSYARRVAVSGRNTEHEPWRWVGGGEIHSLEQDESTELALRAACRFLKVEVFHYDDAPLEIRSVELQAVPRYLVFEAASAGTASLCFRAWDMAAPRFDLSGRVNKESLSELPIFSTQATQPNHARRNNPWRAHARWLGIAAVGLVSAIVVGVIVSMLRQQADGES